MGICYIIGAGESDVINIEKRADDFVICADGGADAAERNGITPDLFVGDFDSLGRVPKGENVIVHPTEKDETDSLLAVNCGLERGYKDFIMYGMLGGRLDHTYANIQLLMYLCEKDAIGTLIGCGYKITAIKNSRVDYDETESGMISVFSFIPESRGITISGLKYEVSDFTLKSTFPMAVSNEFLGKKSYIEVKDGALIIMSEIK
ncbi:MAG: thiamine diphosphokinase [Faecalibacterium sp.]|nr:thiamine diphosphokinase [Ruminococcus sp.]MCM1392371.1 thiamine diphosphokinase [Ruminococcus sp.]MCM1485160.1 thiamine diphosphokinase [Faecalibacterium sp.]